MDKRERLAHMTACARAELRETLGAIDSEYWYGAAKRAADLAARLHRMDELSMAIIEEERTEGLRYGEQPA